jgi:membrane protein YqaA with SNARE-associated domain
MSQRTSPTASTPTTAKDLGALGYVDEDRVSFYRLPVRQHTTASAFDLSKVLEAAAAAGAEGIVIAGFATGSGTPAMDEAMSANPAINVIAEHYVQVPGPIDNARQAMETFIRQHGDAAYSIMFAYAASHSLLLALFAGYAAHSGALGFGTLIVVCWFGSFTGDVIRFWIGRRFGTRWVGPFPRVERAVQTAAQLANRHYVWMILLHRYPHGIRGVAGFAYGMSRLPWKRPSAFQVVSVSVVEAPYLGRELNRSASSPDRSGQVAAKPS